MAKENVTVKLNRMTLDELSIIKVEECSASGAASERARADFPASAAASTDTENTNEPEVPAACVLSDIIILRLGNSLKKKKKRITVKLFKQTNRPECLSDTKAAGQER